MCVHVEKEKTNETFLEMKCINAENEKQKTENLHLNMSEIYNIVKMTENFYIVRGTKDKVHLKIYMGLHNITRKNTIDELTVLLVRNRNEKKSKIVKNKKNNFTSDCHTAELVTEEVEEKRKKCIHDHILGSLRPQSNNDDRQT